MPLLLLSSKTIVPHNTIDTINRDRLFNSFYANSFKKITIVRAPAGYGKTTLITQWLQQVKEPVAWLTIDPSDNDPIRFWKYIIHAISKACNNTLEQVLAPILQSSDIATFEFLIDSLLNEISNMDIEFHLAIDDYHLIENPMIHQTLAQLIEHLPSHAHIYVTTRTTLSLPIAKWRAKQWIHEITMEQLRFTHTEAKQFYRQKSMLPLEQIALERIMHKTEGWAVGLQLANLSDLSDSNKEIDQMQPFISEFLLHEIIATLPTDTQDFLFRTCVLNELKPSICDKLTGRSNSFELLEDLERKGLFTVRLQSAKPIFRYHHLFIDALRTEFKKQLSKDTFQSFISEAATLLEQQEDYIFAIELAMQYELYELANSWIMKHLVKLYRTGQTTTFIQWLHQLRKKQYPVPHEMLVMGLITTISTSEITTSTEIMQELEMRQHLERWMDEPEHLAIAHIYESVKAYAIVAAGGDMTVAAAIIEKQLAKKIPPCRWDDVPIQYNIFEYKILRTSLGSKGKLVRMDEGAAFANLFRETAYQASNATAFSYASSAETLYERNLLDLAKKELEIAIQFGHQYKDPGLYVPMYLLKAKIYTIRQQFIAAQALLDQVIETVQEKHWLTTLRIMKAYCYILAGDLQYADNELHATKAKQPFWLLTNARLLLATEKNAAALKEIIQVKTKALQDEQLVTIIEATVLESICYSKMGNRELALDALHEALERGAPYYYIRTFLDEQEIIPLILEYQDMCRNSNDLKWDAVPLSYLDCFQLNKLEQSHMIDKLTPREKELFQFLTEGATNREIAERLALSEGTVRVYLTNIYSKLGVNTRAKAILLKNYNRK